MPSLMADLASASHIGPFFSTFLMDVVGTAGFALLIVLALVRSRQKKLQGREADLAADQKNALVLGDRILRGQVEYAKDQKVAVRVEVDQEGEESESSGSWSFKWTEKNRRVIVAPFYLRLASGERLRVEPGSDVSLVDALDGMIRIDLTHRIRHAELSPGEFVYVAGMLTRAPDPEGDPVGAYRSPREGYVLRRPRDARMLISPEPLGARFRERASFHYGYAWIITIVALLFHAFFFSYHARRYWGMHTTATIDRLEHRVTQDDDGDDVHHYEVWMNTAKGARFSDSINQDTFQVLAKGQTVPVTYIESPSMFSGLSTIGKERTVSFFAWIGVPLLFFTWLAYVGREKSTRPWYELQVVDTGSGRLFESL